jgi:hypothetical protein
MGASKDMGSAYPLHDGHALPITVYPLRFRVMFASKGSHRATTGRSVSPADHPKPWWVHDGHCNFL